MSLGMENLSDIIQRFDPKRSADDLDVLQFTTRLDSQFGKRIQAAMTDVEASIFVELVPGCQCALSNYSESGEHLTVDLTPQGGWKFSKDALAALRQISS